MARLEDIKDLALIGAGIAVAYLAYKIYKEITGLTETPKRVVEKVIEIATYTPERSPEAQAHVEALEEWKNRIRQIYPNAVFTTGECPYPLVEAAHNYPLVACVMPGTIPYKGVEEILIERWSKIEKTILYGEAPEEYTPTPTVEPEEAYSTSGGYISPLVKRLISI